MNQRMDDLAKTAMVELMRVDKLGGTEFVARRAYAYALAMERVRQEIVDEAEDKRRTAVQLKARVDQRQQTAPPWFEVVLREAWRRILAAVQR